MRKMRCKKHPADYSSTVGVCATCLRERLFALLVAQAQVDAQTQKAHPQDHPLPPPPLVFPRSVSPYVSRCKFEEDGAAVPYHHKFFSTPQVGPYSATRRAKEKDSRRFSLISRLFRSKSMNPASVSDPRVLNVVQSGLPAAAEESTSSSSTSSWWFLTMLTGRRKHQNQNRNREFTLDEFAIKAHRKSRRNRDRGMSPARHSDDDEHCEAGSSGYSSETSHVWKQTPRRTPAVTAATRRSHNRNVSGITFCLSPLVRASPNRHWNQKGLPPEVVAASSAGDVRIPGKPHFTAPTSFCKNRSRKLADFGRFNR